MIRGYHRPCRIERGSNRGEYSKYTDINWWGFYRPRGVFLKKYLLFLVSIGYSSYLYCMKRELLNNMIISGYRVYKYRGDAFKHLFLHSVKLDEFPTLIFIKSKAIK